FFDQPAEPIIITPTITVTEPIPLPDLINETRDWPSGRVGCSLDSCQASLSFAVANAGTAEATAFTTQFSIDGIPVGVYRIEQVLIPGEVAINLVTFDVPPSCVDTSTPCEICIMVDSQNELLEENEANNKYCEAL
ncbi:MAG: hypothetical protein KC449_29275, partial [Anaerolineales bacterium]|nr:hypothetical protein [Anaerolineales bacterium]